MRSLRIRSTIPRIAAAIVFGLVGACAAPSDEQVLRSEFGIPSSVRLIEMDVHPKEPGFFGREGLTIEARFAFSDEQFESYLRQVTGNPLWRPMPPSREFLMKMFGVRRSIEGLRQSYEMSGRKPPPVGSAGNPTEDQLYERAVKTIPLDVTAGFYQCKTAGDNLMHNKKSPCESRSGDLNDYMLAVLDVTSKELLIRVKTAY